jgi:protein-disulfide isomerase
MDEIKEVAEAQDTAETNAAIIEPEIQTQASSLTLENIDLDDEKAVFDIEGRKEARAASSLPNPWVLLMISLLVGGLGGFYLRPVVIPESRPNAVAPLAAVEASDQMNEIAPHQSVMLAVIAGARHFNGDPNAPVTLVEFGDFNCGYCARWAAQTLPRIQEKYIDTGKVRMAFVHFPILGADSITAAEATECAARQDKFWEYHNTLYANIGIGYSHANLTNLAEQTGLNIASFTECLSNFPERESLEDDIRLGQIMGVRGTPAFLVNGIPLAGAYPYEDFERLIEHELAARAPQPSG